MITKPEFVRDYTGDSYSSRTKNQIVLQMPRRSKFRILAEKFFSAFSFSK